jgi:hypothetical protein
MSLGSFFPLQQRAQTQQARPDQHQGARFRSGRGGGAQCVQNHLMTVGVVHDRPVVAIGRDAYPIRELAAGAQRAVLQDVDGNADHHLEPVSKDQE